MLHIVVIQVAFQSEIYSYLCIYQPNFRVRTAFINSWRAQMLHRPYNHTCIGNSFNDHLLDRRIRFSLHLEVQHRTPIAKPMLVRQ